MKVKLIEKHINSSGRRGFTFWNDVTEVNWVVITHKDKILARKTLIDGKNVETAYFYEVPRDRADEVKALYDEIILDFVDVCFDDFGLEYGVQPFCDFAGPEDYDLFEVLSEFGVGYGTFLNDVVFQFRVKSEVDNLVGSDDCRCEREPSMTEGERLAKRVVSRLGNIEAMIKFADGATAQWKIAKAHGELWYERSTTELIGGPYIILEEDYGHMKLNDTDGAFALRDAILADLNDDRTIIAYNVDDGIMDLFNISVDDFDDNE